MAAHAPERELARPPRERFAAGHPSGLQRAGTVAWQLAGILVLVLIVGWALGKLMPVLLPVAIAILLATLLQPVARHLQSLGMGPGLAAAASLLLVFVVVVAVLVLVVPPFVAKLSELGSSVEDGFRKLTYSVGQDLAGMSRAEVDRAVDDAISSLRDRAGNLTGSAVPALTTLLGALGTLVLVFFLAFFMVKDGRSMWSWMVGLAPPERRLWLDNAGRRSWAALGTYVKGVVFVATIDAVFIGIALLALGVPLALPLIILTWFAAFFPVIGAIAAGLAAILVTLVAQGFVPALIVTAVIILVQQLEGNVLYPVVVGPRLRLHPITVLLAVAAGGTIAGLAGAFLAVPAATVAAAVLRQARAPDPVAVSAEPAGMPPSDGS